MGTRWRYRSPRSSARQQHRDAARACGRARRSGPALLHESASRRDARHGSAAWGTPVTHSRGQILHRPGSVHPARPRRSATGDGLPSHSIQRRPGEAARAGGRPGVERRNSPHSCVPHGSEHGLCFGKRPSRRFSAARRFLFLHP
jgi:hypothetical protein